MKKHVMILLGSLVAIAAATQATAQPLPQPVKLLKPNLERGANIMKALSDRRAVRQFADREISLVDLSDLLWAADGINREDGRRTAPSARNRQNISIYVCRAEGSYLYNPKTSVLEPVSGVDLRWDKIAPLYLILVSNVDDSMSGVDAGVVSQNISLFCSGVGTMGTVCRAMMDRKKVAEVLNLGDKLHPVINHPVGYLK
ncbi:MAG: SagB/ThcOx family dehydrogenase [Rikenellaceae bacterium]|jgi:nitroreductase|nr:SagB/ThcOx family dehydrogenase [Rikenellaceae bacterium]